MAKQRKRFFSLWNDITLLMQLHAHQTILNLWHHNSIKMLQQENMVCPYKKHTSSGVSLYSQGRMQLELLSEELEQLPNQAEQRENIAQNNVINTWTTWITLWTTRTIPEQSPHDNSNNSLCNSDNWQYYVNNWTSSLHSTIIFSKSLHNTQNNSTQRLVTFWKLLVVTFAIVPFFLPELRRLPIWSGYLGRHWTLHIFISATKLFWRIFRTAWKPCFQLTHLIATTRHSVWRCMSNIQQYWHSM